MKRTVKAIASATRDLLTEQAKTLAAVARKGGDVLAAVDDLDHEAYGHELARVLGTMANDGSKAALRQVRSEKVAKDASADDMDEMLSLANERGIDWAEDHAAELVGMKRIDGKWVPNPNADWCIPETTRDAVRLLTERALEEGWSNDMLADQLMEDEAFGESRAMMVARTETAFADVQGNLIGWEESGVVAGKEWFTSADEYCDLCQEMNGKQVSMGEPFDFDGEAIDGPPGHPNCRCDVLPVLAD